MPGAGKTTLGKALAKLLKVRFYDLDTMVEESTGKTVRDIFHERGEGYFRMLESNVLETFLADAPETYVIATGGGTPCFNNNLEKMKLAATTLFIDMPKDILVKRVEDEIAKRPLLVGKTVAEKLDNLYTQRIDIYRKAHTTLTYQAEPLDASVQRALALITQQY